jgi:dipeptidyl-peptidase-4
MRYRRRSRTAVGSLLAAICTVVLTAQVQPPPETKPLTIEDIYGYGGRSRFNGSSEAGLNWAPKLGVWLSDTHYLWPTDRDASWLRVDAHSGNSEPLFTYSAVEAALSKIGIAADEARRLARHRPSVFNRRFDGFLLTIADDYYYYDIREALVTRLTNSAGTKTEPAFSPDGRALAFIKNNNLYVTQLSSPAEFALTTDGAADLLNGKLDWVYSEELYGRGNYRGYWWSPDSSHIAFLQLNEKPVPEYTLVDDIPYHPRVQRWNYPKAGDPNPIARLGIVAVNNGAGGSGREEPATAQRHIRWADTSQYSDFLIVSVAWTPDSRSAVYQVQNRQQTWLDLNRADRDTGATSTILKESSKTWVERWQDESADPVWLNDESFLWLSERTGWRHLYHYRSDGSLINQVTNGDWEIRELHGVDDGQWIYFSATERSPIDLDTYRIALDGTRLQRLTSTAGTHKPFFNPSHLLYLDSRDDVVTPSQVRLHRTDSNEPVRIVDANPVTTAQAYGFSKPEFVQVKTRDGFVMEAMMIKPPAFDPARRYPVYQFTYGGPHSQQVSNGWGSTTYVYHQLLAQRGIIVWICDNRTSSGKGALSTWPLHKNLGELELRDIEDGLAWLRAQPFVDATRIGISGISYGGFMTLYALTHSKSFTMGIAEGPVSDWRDYDTIYTERYLGLPQENPDGYRKSSPRFEAAALSGQLLLIHSALDDNVHPQNAMQFAYELQKAGKPFQMMLYPKSAHGISDPELAPHLRNMMLDFTLRNLLR